MNESFSRDTTLAIFERIGNISGLSITMDVEKVSDDFLVRILLEDSDGRKHLVAESYRELAADTPFQRFSNYCEETAILPDVTPVRLHVFTQNATVKIHTLSYTLSNTAMRAKGLSARLQEKENLRKQQVQAKVDQINAYNAANNKLWRAGVTGLSLKSQEDKMRSLGFSENANIGGFEYYAGGIFELYESTSDLEHDVNTDLYPNDSLPVKEFDWTNRHGENWMTSVKNQGNSAYCTGFATVGALEAVMNLYYNTHFHLDLSAQQAVCCTPDNDFPYETGAITEDVVNFVASNDIFDAESYPFVDDTGDSQCKQDQISPKYRVHPNGYVSMENSTVSEIRDRLINYGPMVSGFSRAGMGHAMTLVGFGTIQAGDTIALHNNIYNINYQYIVPSNDERIGRTYWKFQNSYGESSDSIERAPFIYMIFNNRADMTGPYSFELPISVTHISETGTKVYSENDIVCEDRDGDFFYYWGIGPMPSVMPNEALNGKDFDDGDASIGPLVRPNVYRNLNPETNDTIDSSLLTFSPVPSSVVHCYNHVLAADNSGYDGNVGHIYFHNGAKLIIDSGAIYNLGGDNIIYNADIEMRPGSKLVIRDGCRVILRQGASFNPPIGASVEIQNGSIEPYIDHFPTE